MATSRKRTVEIDVVVDDKAASAKLRGIGDEAAKSAKGFSGLSGGMKVAAAAAVAFVGTRVVDFLGDAAQAAAEDEASQKQLALALKNTTGATKESLESTEAWIDGMARSRGVADDELRPALANLVRAHGDEQRAQEDLTVAMDIAAARGLDVESVTLAMAKAANGNVGALGRMGIATKDAEGNMLTYDEVLKEASRTMGGAAMEASMSLEGQLKRQRVAWEETKEMVGAQVLPIMSTAANTFSFFASAVAGETEHSITNMTIAFNDLLKVGIDPLADPLRSFVAILVESEKHVAANSDSLNVLIGMLGLEGESLQTASQYLRDHGTELGLNEEQVKNLITQLNLEDQAARDAARGLGVARGELDLNTEATYANLEATKELTDPLFGVLAAEERLAEATAAYTAALQTNAPWSDTATDAALALTKAQQDADLAASRYAEEGGPASVDAFMSIAREAGISEDMINRMIAAMERANRTPLRRVGDRVTGGGGTDTNIVGRQHMGGVVPGDFPGQEVVTLTRAGERFGSAVPANGHGAGVGVIQFNVDGRTLFEQVVLPEMVRYRKRNGSI